MLEKVSARVFVPVVRATKYSRYFKTPLGPNAPTTIGGLPPCPLLVSSPFSFSSLIYPVTSPFPRLITIIFLLIITYNLTIHLSRSLYPPLPSPGHQRIATPAVTLPAVSPFASRIAPPLPL